MIASSARRPAERYGFSLVELLVVVAIIGILIALFMPSVRTARPAARRVQCKNHLKQIALALHNYADAHGAFPPAYTVDLDGKPLHSWRTLILPFLDQQALYDSIDLSKPWDDPANAAAYTTRVPVYQCPEHRDPTNLTTYLAVVASGGCFQPVEPRELSEITDSLSSTLMVFEAHPSDAVHWMEPRDADDGLVMKFGPGNALPHAGGTHAVFVDGSVQFLSGDLPAAARYALITIAGDDDAAAESEL